MTRRSLPSVESTSDRWTGAQKPRITTRTYRIHIFRNFANEKSCYRIGGEGGGGGVEWGVLHVKAAVLVRSSAVAK